MKKMLTVVAGVLVAGSLMSSVARADMMVGQDKSTWSPYSIGTEANGNVRLGEDESTWGPYADEFIANAGVITGEDESTWPLYSIGLEEKTVKVGVPDPFTVVKNLKEAEKKTGVKVTAPKKIKGYDEISYQIMKEEKFVQVSYSKDDKNSITIRKAVAKDDISGDHNEYKNTKKVTVKGYKVKLEANGKTYSLATWTKGKYSFSVGIYNDGKGMSLKEIKSIIGQVK